MKSIDTKLDAIWSKIIHLRDEKCAVCKSCSALSAHHIFRRENKSTRWDLNNGVLLCFDHHTESSLFSAHKTDEKFKDWYAEQIGIEAFYSLQQKANQTVHLADFEKEEIYEVLKSKYLELNNSQ